MLFYVNYPPKTVDFKLKRSLVSISYMQRRVPGIMKHTRKQNGINKDAKRRKDWMKIREVSWSQPDYLNYFRLLFTVTKQENTKLWKG